MVQINNISFYQSPQTKLPDFSAIIFDMDGLVLDTETTYCIAWQKASAEMGYKLTKDFCLSMSGLHFQDVEKKLLDFCGVNFNLHLFGHLSGNYWRQTANQHGIAVKKGFFNLVKVLKSQNIAFCLATNSKKANTLECLRFANLDNFFSSVITRDNVKYGKPAPDIFYSAAEALNVHISQCLVLEDSKTGIQAASLAGAISIFIPSVFPVESSTIDLADYLFNDLDEIAHIINQE